MTDEELKAIAQAQATSGPQPDWEYLHYKGGRYVIVARALREDTLEPVVIYRSIAKGFTWERTLANFAEMVEVDGRRVRRFAKATIEEFFAHERWPGSFVPPPGRLRRLLCRAKGGHAWSTFLGGWIDRPGDCDMCETCYKLRGPLRLERDTPTFPGQMR
jgi:hypothetical protein